MNAETKKMAREFFGYGRWDAPYWFIGPEQGGGENPERAVAFMELQRKKSPPDGLCDCKEFHEAIKEYRWHFKEPVELQWTWKRLMLLLMAYLDKPSNEDSLRKYQRDCWGSSRGETCVIDLSGLSFKSFHESGEFNADRDNAETLRTFRKERAKKIKERMETLEQKPELVVVYGYSQEKLWNQILEIDLTRDTVKKNAKTVIVFGPHPAAYGKGIENSDLKWRRLGQSARELMS